MYYDPSSLLTLEVKNNLDNLDKIALCNVYCVAS